MSNCYGTFPYKLWDLINSSKNNGINWSNDGKAVIIHKKLFQKKCLNKGIFKTSKFLSFTKQLNVYGFVQQAHRFGPRMILAYKHDNFQQGHRELLRDFCRRVTISSSKAPSSKSMSSSQQQKSTSGELNIVMQARLNFKCILHDNVQKVLALPSDLTSCCDSDSSLDIKHCTKETRPLCPLPPRKDPRFLMWNGYSDQPDACSINLFPNTTFSHHNPQPSPFNPVNECCSSIVVCLVDNEEPVGDKNFLSFAMENEELKEILLDEEFEVMYEDYQATHQDNVKLC